MIGHARTALLAAALALAPAAPLRAAPPDAARIQKVIDSLAPLRVEENRRRHWEYGTVAPEDGRLLQILTQTLKARHVLEIGTGIGFSALYIGLALQRTGGRLTTIENDPARVRAARENFRKAGLDGVITVVEGDALEVLPKLKTPVDLVFSDALKMDNVEYLDLFMPLVRVGGLVVAHDVNAAGGQARKMRDYLDMLKRHPCLDSVLTTDETYPAGILGPGLGLSYKRCADLDGKSWSRAFVKTVLQTDQEGAGRGVPGYQVLEEYQDDFGNSRLLLLVDRGTGKEALVRLGKTLLKKYERQGDFSAHIYDSREAYENRDVMTYPAERYFKHLVARVARHRKAGHDEIHYYPDALLLLVRKAPGNRQ